MIGQFAEGITLTNTIRLAEGAMLTSHLCNDYFRSG